MKALAFDFGQNWQAFSAARLDPRRFRAAVNSLESLMGSETLDGKSFLDVGCGSGLFSLAAAALGCQRVVGIDINPTCVQTCIDNVGRLRGSIPPDLAIDFRQGSALDSKVLADLGTFDVVYAWGCLHHTGAMWDAIRNTAARVAPGGIFTLAIYNAHWSCWGWKQIKRLYNICPHLLRGPLNGGFAVVIGTAKWLVTRRNPFHKERGMDFWFDVVDWLGGYPYEYAPADVVRKFVEGMGFTLLRHVPPAAPTGCNEFVFHAH